METASGSGALEWQGTIYRIKLAGSQSGGVIGLFESLNPAGSGPPRHIHHAEDETFCILSGQLEFWLEGQRRLCGPGETVFVPRGSSHSFRVTGDLPARMLTIMTPGGFEGFFARMAQGRYRIPDDMIEITRIATEFNLTFTGPPLAADNPSPL